MTGGASDCTSLSSKPLQAAIEKRINAAGFGLYQILSLVCTGGIMMSEGSEMSIMSSITEIVGEEWQLNSFMRGFLVSIVYVGFGVGNMCSGALGDRYGRRPTILLAYLIIGSFGFLTAVATNTVMMVAFRFVCGVGCGIGFAAVYTLITEICPVELRGPLCAAMIGFMPLGETYAALGVLFIDKELAGLTSLKYPLPLPAASWRRLCEWSAAPSIILVLTCSIFLKESPYFLARTKRYEELNKALTSMEYWNGVPLQDDVPIPEADGPQSDASKKASEPSFSYQAALAKIFGGRLFTTTLVLFFAHFTKDFSYFGCNYVFPQYFTAITDNIAVGIELLIVSFISLPGVAFAVWLTQWDGIGHIRSLKYVSLTCGFVAISLLNFLAEVFHEVGACLIKNLIIIYFIVTVVYTAEVFPTSIRNTAVGICTACGRVGSISAPLVFELISGYDSFWVLIISFMWTISLLASSLLTIETKGKALSDDDSHKDEMGYQSMGKSSA
mmetsp:Transcript_70137/g.176715  ORF Transcript_70137/g.176715 Transcript_70137/m.176715 type:complete len:500 (-) Transcript_70137:127-1626(-)